MENYSDGEASLDEEMQEIIKRTRSGKGARVQAGSLLSEIPMRKINFSPLTAEESHNISSQAESKFKVSYRKQEDSRIRVKDKSDRATTELVMDARTKLILHKLIRKELIVEVSGCISTGKEANVYHAVDAKGKEFAVKIYKTSVLIFKDRDRYVSGEFRFRRGYCKHNPRKMVTMWAEKEFRNLTRMKAAGMRVPEPIIVRGHVLLMEFLGKNMAAAPILRDAKISGAEEHELYYRKTLLVLRRLFQECKLVHADFSEYNLLVKDGEIFVIDVSQAVEHDHPMSLEFLKRDCANINRFFEHRGVTTLSLKGAFYVIIENEKEINEDYLANLIKERKDNPDSESRFNDELFKNLFIPRTLFDVDVEKLHTVLPDQINILKKISMVPEKRSSSVDNQEDISEEDEKSSSSDQKEEKKGKFDPFEGMSKKERKQKVKLEKREKRKDKIPKYIKKKAQKKKK